MSKCGKGVLVVSMNSRIIFLDILYSLSLCTKKSEYTSTISNSGRFFDNPGISPFLFSFLIYCLFYFEKVNSLKNL